MENMTRDEFERMKQTAFEKALQTHKNRMPFPDFVSIPASAAEPQPIDPPVIPVAEPNTGAQKSGGTKKQVSSLIKYMNLPEMMKNGDSLLLLGLILLLSNESADETLILALAYILL